MDLNEHIHFTVNQLFDTWCELAKNLLNNPDLLMSTQTSYWQDYLSLYQNSSVNSISSFDKRFQDKQWQENSIFNFIKHSYLLINEHVDNLVNQVSRVSDDKIAQKLRFFTHQLLDAISPTNFANTNPEVISKILETNGENLISGYKQFLADIIAGKGQLNITMSDQETFELGKNIACTPGKIIYQNDLMQLIQYAPTTDTIYQNPLLIIPPWINKYYILDLQKENSMVKWLVDQGFNVFMISWVNPSQQHKEKKFDDYMLEGPLTALKIISKITNNSPVNALGYCIGGTLLGCTLAYLAKKNISRILSATFLTTLFDFSEPGELGTFIDESQVSALEKEMQKTGYLNGKIMAIVFNALRANDLIWNSFINNYLKGQKPKPFDLLYWNADSTNIPYHVHSFYLRNMYLKNALIQPNKIKLDRVSLDLRKISIPCYFLAAQDDHIIPWKSCYASQQRLTAPVKFVLASSGHVAGVVNHPEKKKYGYWIHLETSKNPDEFLAKAEFHSNSWWTDWIKWLLPFSGQLQSIASLDLSKQKIIEDAPGSYVKVRIL